MTQSTWVMDRLCAAGDDTPVLGRGDTAIYIRVQERSPTGWRPHREGDAILEAPPWGDTTMEKCQLFSLLYGVLRRRPQNRRDIQDTAAEEHSPQNRVAKSISGLILRSSRKGVVPTLQTDSSCEASILDLLRVSYKSSSKPLV